MTKIYSNYNSLNMHNIAMIKENWIDDNISHQSMNYYTVYFKTFYLKIFENANHINYILELFF